MVRRGARCLGVSSHAGFDDRSEEGPGDRVWNSCPRSMRVCFLGLNAKSLESPILCSSGDCEGPEKGVTSSCTNW
ncbi:uncharacterized protein DS421_18g611050 [Arachis hypogaea]|nr:uncharacterized protein DS421_18g611050 [Arachis hypogaea]